MIIVYALEIKRETRNNFEMKKNKVLFTIKKANSLANVVVKFY